MTMGIAVVSSEYSYLSETLGPNTEPCGTNLRCSNFGNVGINLSFFSNNKYDLLLVGSEHQISDEQLYLSRKTFVA